MPAAAPRISQELIDAIALLDDGAMPIADLWRLAGDRATALGLTRPSYEQLRLWVHEIRGSGWTGPTVGSAAQVALDVAFRVRPPEALVEHLAGDGWAQPRRARRG